MSRALVHMANGLLLLATGVPGATTTSAFVVTAAAEEAESPAAADASPASAASENTLLSVCQKIPSNVAYWAKRLFHPTGTPVYSFDMSPPPTDGDALMRGAKRKLAEVEVWQGWHAAIETLKGEMDQTTQQVAQIDAEHGDLWQQRCALDHEDMRDHEPPATPKVTEEERAEWRTRRQAREDSKRRFDNKLRRRANERRMRTAEHDALQAQLQAFYLKITLAPISEWEKLVRQYVDRLSERADELQREADESTASSARSKLERQNQLDSVLAIRQRLSNFLLEGQHPLGLATSD